MDRSSFWATDLGKEMSSSAVDADLANFASGVRGHIRFASSCPKVLASAVKYVPLPGHVRTGSVVALGQLYRAVASAMLGHLNVRGPFLAAQVGIGSQPRKAVFTTVPEFKRFVHVSLPSLPELTVKGRLKAPLTVQDTVLPAGSKLLPPLAFRAADCVGGRCDISSRVHLSDSHSSDQLDATDDTGVLRSAPPLCGSPSAPPPLLGLGGAALGLGGCLANDYGASQSQCSGDAPGNSPGADEASPDCAKCTVPSKSLQLQPCVTDSEADLLALGREEGVTESELVQIFVLPACRQGCCRVAACEVPTRNFNLQRLPFTPMCAPMHRDASNLEGTANYVAPLTSFEQGGIWIQDEDGEHVRTTPRGKAHGRVLQVCKGPVEFDAHQYHCTLPREGSRVVLIGFTPRNLASIKQADVQLLLDLGFPLPGHTPSCKPVRVAHSSVQPCKSGKWPPADVPAQSSKTMSFGVPFTESEFVSAAVKAGHRRSMVSALPAHLESCVDLLARAQPHAVVERRRQWLDKWTARAAEIGVSPDPAWEIDDPHMRHVLSKKHLQLLDEIIAAEGYEDVNLARDIQSGLDLVGKSPVSNVLPGKVTPATLHPDDLIAAASRSNEAVQTSLGSSGDVDRDLQLWDKTLQEVEKGWLIGPYDWDSLPADHVVSHRFRTGSSVLLTTIVVVVSTPVSQHLNNRRSTQPMWLPLCSRGCVMGLPEPRDLPGSKADRSTLLLPIDSCAWL